MADAPHQLESLSEEITRLKAELKRKEELLDHIERAGQSSAGGGTSTTWPDVEKLQQRIDWLRAQIRAKVGQLTGDANPPGIISTAFHSGYNP